MKKWILIGIILLSTIGSPLKEASNLLSKETKTEKREKKKKKMEKPKRQKKMFAYIAIKQS
ncbi:MAG: hypothetical protein IJY54_06990 [Paludibacteraceae bacterium]|nr:hypothetical protein [Bacteroidales bacterium]MBO5132840.1 hypothetical protein [Paludibacteraceae bacterium]MBQ9101102.1 hypothetical protein [Paludibacteraceae bacterium]